MKKMIKNCEMMFQKKKQLVKPVFQCFLVNPSTSYYAFETKRFEGFGAQQLAV